MSYHHRQVRARDAPSDPPAQEDEENQSLLGSAPTRAAPRSVPQPQHQHNISSASSSPVSAFDFDHKAWTKAKAASVAFVLFLALYNIITSSGSTSSLQLSSIPKAETAVSASKIGNPWLHTIDLIVKEEDFLEDPVGSLDKAISLSKTKLEEKLEGLRLMQRIVSADQSDSLFVPAFAREIVETMKEKGLATGPISTPLCNSSSVHNSNHQHASLQSHQQMPICNQTT
eukprot:scaffold13115_cov139-Skeletonema_dohrnii-CCMP3373.AAC.4